MQTVQLYQVDAFTRTAFRGNPAAVCLLPAPLDDALMLAIAAEMNLSETAFVTRLEERPWAACKRFALRWFTPRVEVPLCGHATLASAAVLFDQIAVKCPRIVFETFSGDLSAQRADAGVTLDFPAEKLQAFTPSADILAALGLSAVVGAVYGPRTKKLLLHLADERQLRSLRPDFVAMKEAADIEELRGLIVTTSGDAPYDFVSRYFAPWVGVDEDPVTGSAHTLLTPYWAQRLGKRQMLAYQASARGGELRVGLIGAARVAISGAAVVIFKGELFV